MKTELLTFLVFGAVAFAADNKVIAILKYQQEGVNDDGSYKWNYETENGISAEEQGRQVDEENQEAAGNYHYTSPEGIEVLINYIANALGFQPQGDLIPTPPPIPPEILESLKWNAEHPEEEDPKEQEKYEKYEASNQLPVYQAYSGKGKLKAPYKRY